MKAIHAIWKDGRVVPAQPVDRPACTPLTVEPIEGPEAIESEVDLLGDDPDSISRWIASFDALPPLRMSEAEEAEWQAARRGLGSDTVAKMNSLIGDRP